MLPLSLFLLLSTGGVIHDTPLAHLEVNADAHAYDDALTAVREATVATNIDPITGADRLERALERLLAHAPALSVDPGGRDIQLMGELALARAALVLDEPAKAAEIMDRILTILLISDEIDTFDQTKLGPTLASLFDERKAAAPYDKMARLRAVCSSRCTVFVDGREVESDLATRVGAPLTIGRHHVVIEGDDFDRIERFVEIERLGSVLEIKAGRANDPPPPNIDEPLEPDVVELPPGPRPAAPRGVEVALLVAGLAGAGAGASLWAIDDTCASGGPRRGVDACADLFDTKVAGISALAAGASVAITASIMLAIDERRRRKSGGSKWAKRP